MAYKEGDFVEVNTSKEKLKGYYMPSSKEIITIKLENGYNVGIDKTKIKSIKKLKSVETKKKKVSIKQNSKLPKITILHTGGTIASKVDYATGGVSAKFTPEDMLNMFPELKKIGNVSSRLVSNIFSEDMRFGHYNLLAKEIEKEVNKGVKGIIITHGTDTLHYTASALSFILENLPIPVVLVGAQRSSDRGSSDAAVNLIGAAHYISKTKIPEVVICMHRTMEDNQCVIIKGTNARKMHSSRRDAFKSINCEDYAYVNWESGETIFNFKSKKVEEKLKLKLFKEDLKIGVLKIHPQMFPEEFSFYKKFDGLVLEGTGLGHTPLDSFDKYTKIHEKIKKEIVNLKIPIVMSVQTIFGAVNMNVYSKGIDLKNLRVISGESITPETCFIKLAWLLSNYPKKVEVMFKENLRGEINKRLGTEFL